MRYICDCEENSVCSCDVAAIHEELDNLEAEIVELNERIKLIEDTLNGSVNKERQEED